ncbi:MAG: gluconolactonase [Candidatus Hydrogenedentota bacterium]
MYSLLFAGMVIFAQAELVSGPLEIVADGCAFTEGPVWLPSGKLVFSDIPNDTIFEVPKKEFRKPSGKSNGLAVDPEGRLIACEHWNRRVSRTEKDGTITVLADTFEGKKLNSPNDAVVRSDGVIFFTDPPYGLEERTQEQPVQGVYAILADGTLKRIADDFKKPNGIGLSPDEKTLYVADTDGGHIRSFAVAKDGSLSGGKVFCELKWPDGMAVDRQGHVWCTAEDGVQVFSPDGVRVTTVSTPATPANCGFGDTDLQTLYITARDSVYRIRTTVQGLYPAAQSAP